MSARLLVIAPRGSGGAITHLANVLPRLRQNHPDWRIELYASQDTLRQAFQDTDQPWMHSVGSGDYLARLRWELRELPRQGRSSPETLVYAPFGPHFNVGYMHRTVWMARNIIPLLDTREWEVSRGERPRLLALRGLFAVGARLSPRVICVSQHAKQKLVALARVAPERIAVVPHGCEATSPDQPLIDASLAGLMSEPYTLCVGQPIPYRRTRELIKAQAALATRRSVPRLVLVGAVRPVDAEYGAECERLAEPLIRDGKLAALGQVRRSDVRTLTARAHTIVYPSVHEDCPNVILEALAAGRVIVCADIPATRELADGAAVFVRDPKPDTLADAMEGILFDDGRRAALQRAASERAAVLTWDRCAERVGVVLAEELRKHRKVH